MAAEEALMKHFLIFTAPLLVLAATVGVAEPAPIPEAPPSVAEQVAAMPLEQRIAQLMLVTLQGRLGADHSERALLNSMRPGGVVLLPPSQPGDTAEFIADLRQGEQAGAVPLFIATDLRRVVETPSRLMSPYLQLPTPLAVAATRNPQNAGVVAGILAHHLKTMGFNTCLGPSLAVAPLVASGEGTLYGYGGDPRFVGMAGAAFIKTLNASGVLAIARDFPGGPGISESNALPILAASQSVLAERYLPPFQAAIDAGVPAVQLCNVIVPAFSPENLPAPLTPYATQSVLRGAMGFKGLVVTGPMDDPGLAPYADPVHACMAALNAGADLLYWQGPSSVLQGVIPALRRGVEEGRVPEERVNEAVARVLAQKQALDLAGRPLPERGVADKLLRDSDSHKTLAAIERQSLTLIKNDDHILPLTRETSTPVLVTGVAGVRELKDRLEKPLKDVGEQPISTAKHIGDIADFEVYRATRQAAGTRTVVLILGPTVRARSQRELLQGLKAEGARVVLVYLGHPNEAVDLVEADAVLLAYADPRLADGTLDAVADALTGKTALAVEPPAAPMRGRAGEEISFSAADWVWAPAGRLPVDVSAELLTGTAARGDVAVSAKKVEWTFGDGKHGKGLTIQHRFAEPGWYAVTLTVTDPFGLESAATAQVEVE
jgi:beta-N-acetylhexosaminidase